MGDAFFVYWCPFGGVNASHDWVLGGFIQVLAVGVEVQLQASGIHILCFWITGYISVLFFEVQNSYQQYFRRSTNSLVEVNQGIISMVV